MKNWTMTSRTMRTTRWLESRRVSPPRRRRTSIRSRPRCSAASGTRTLREGAILQSRRSPKRRCRKPSARRSWRRRNERSTRATRTPRCWRCACSCRPSRRQSTSTFRLPRKTSRRTGGPPPQELLWARCAASRGRSSRCAERRRNKKATRVLRTRRPPQPQTHHRSRLCGARSMRRSPRGARTGRARWRRGAGEPRSARRRSASDSKPST
mmetsp:Transcript_18620/g.74349  ORF Transcript_18620/g.74349 Transcript_18620/m.74349 type:complete len:211 (-) Transcript_18620:1467-2099(-)